MFFFKILYLINKTKHLNTLSLTENMKKVHKHNEMFNFICTTTQDRQFYFFRVIEMLHLINTKFCLNNWHA